MHEQSETIRGLDNLWWNIFGRNTANAGSMLPGERPYATLPEAISGAKIRSNGFENEPNGPLELQRFYERAYSPPILEADPLQYIRGPQMDDWQTYNDYGSYGSDLYDEPGSSVYASGYDFPPQYAPQQPQADPAAQYQPRPTGSQGFMPQSGGPQQGSWIDQLLGTKGGVGTGAALGSLGPLAGLIGLLASGGRTQTQGFQQPQQSRAAGVQMQGALGAQQAQAGYNTPLQQMQMSLLQALQSGQGLPQGYQKLVEQAYQPAMGDIASQAINSARNRGFAGGAELLNSGPGGAIAGPALANLQGQMAGSKLGLMQSLPALYNQPIQAQGQAMNAQIAGQGNLMDNYRPFAQSYSQMPLGQIFGQGIGNIFAGANAGANAYKQGNDQQTLLDYLRGMSGTPDRETA